MAGKISVSTFAAQVGVSGSAIRKAIGAGRLTADADGLLDPVAALAQWQHNRQRQRRPKGADQAAEAAPDPAAGGRYWDHRTDREAAEAEMAKLRAAEMRGDLVRRDAIVQEFATLLITLREALANLAARVAPLAAAESNAAAVERMLRDEHRQALAQFVAELEPAKAAE